MIRHTRLSNDTATTEIYTLSLHDALGGRRIIRSEEHTSELQSHDNLVCRLLLEKKTRRPGRPRPRTTFAARGLGAPALLAGLRSALGGAVAAAGCGGVPCPVAGGNFFFNDAAPPEFSPFPHPDALRI